MKKNLEFIVFVSFVVFVFSCKSKAKEDNSSKAIVKDTINYYPSSFFLGEDIRAVLQSGAKIYKTTIINKVKVDSVQIDTAAFNAFASRFLQKDISQSPNKKFYKESIFRSLSTNSITFNYSSINPDLDIRSVDASVSEGDNKLKRIDIRVISTKNDSSFTENYSWLAGVKCYVTKYAEGKDGKGVSSITTVSWHK